MAYHSAHVHGTSLTSDVITDIYNVISPNKSLVCNVCDVTLLSQKFS